MKTTIPKRARRGTSGKSRADIIAAKIVREKYGARYFALACEHETSWEVQQLYKAWQPKGKYWCEKCGHWSKAIPKPSYPPLPDKPPY